MARPVSVRRGCILCVCLTWYAMPSSFSLAVQQFTGVSVADNTLFHYDPEDQNSLFHSNGRGDFVGVGRTYRKSLIRRGLVRFQLTDVPTDALILPGTLELQLTVVDYPSRDTTPRPFWFVPAPQAWGEGSSVANAGVSGAGAGAPATDGDATWFHTAYDSELHDPAIFDPPAPGLWLQRGIFGDDSLDPADRYGAPAGVVDTLGSYTFQTPALESIFQAWIHAPVSNLGLVILGDETVDSNEESSKRDFATREHAVASFRPFLRFDYLPRSSADFNDDGAIDAADAGYMFSNWGQPGEGDINADGIVDAADAALLAFAWTGDYDRGHVNVAVPEPVSGYAWLATVLLLLARRGTDSS